MLKWKSKENYHINWIYHADELFKQLKCLLKIIHVYLSI